MRKRLKATWKKARRNSELTLTQGVRTMKGNEVNSVTSVDGDNTG